MLSVKHESETHHVKVWPDGRCEPMPRSYSYAVLNGIPVTNRRNNSRSLFARTNAAYRRIEERLDGRRRTAAKEVR